MLRHLADTDRLLDHGQLSTTARHVFLRTDRIHHAADRIVPALAAPMQANQGAGNPGLGGGDHG